MMAVTGKRAAARVEGAQSGNVDATAWATSRHTRAAALASHSDRDTAHVVARCLSFTYGDAGQFLKLSHRCSPSLLCRAGATMPSVPPQLRLSATSLIQMPKALGSDFSSLRASMSVKTTTAGAA